MPDAMTTLSVDPFRLGRDNRTTAQRLADVLAESRREDTSTQFRLGLLQGALEVALPDLLGADHA